MNELETKAMPLLKHCNTGRTCLQLPITTRENTSLAIHILQKMRKKSKNPRFEI